MDTFFLTIVYGYLILPASECSLKRSGACTCRRSDAQVSKDQRMRVLEGKKCSILRIAKSPLYIEVEAAKPL